MEFPVITAMAAAVLLVMCQLLGLAVGMYRVRTRQGVGHGADPDLERVVRRHGNLAENAPFFLLVLGLLELYVGSTSVVTGFAVAFVLARIAHMIGFSSLTGSHLSQGNPLFLLMRSLGAGVSSLSAIGLGGYLLYLLV